jgi:hypothetical protein
VCHKKAQVHKCIRAQGRGDRRQTTEDRRPGFAFGYAEASGGRKMSNIEFSMSNVKVKRKKVDRGRKDSFEC